MDSVKEVISSRRWKFILQSVFVGLRNIAVPRRGSNLRPMMPDRQRSYRRSRYVHRFRKLFCFVCFVLALRIGPWTHSQRHFNYYEYMYGNESRHGPQPRCSISVVGFRNKPGSNSQPLAFLWDALLATEYAGLPIWGTHMHARSHTLTHTTHPHAGTHLASHTHARTHLHSYHSRMHARTDPHTHTHARIRTTHSLTHAGTHLPALLTHVNLTCVMSDIRFPVT